MTPTAIHEELSTPAYRGDLCDLPSKKNGRSESVATGTVGAATVRV